MCRGKMLICCVFLTICRCVGEASGPTLSARGLKEAQKCQVWIPTMRSCCCPTVARTGPDDVLPFMRNATRGRGIPDERLLQVAAHYKRFGGISPINACNQRLIADLSAELAKRGRDIPVGWGNRANLTA